MLPRLALLALAAALFTAPAAARAATVRVVPVRSPGVPESAAVALVRATEAAIREVSSLVVLPALDVSASSRRCGAEDPACWAGLAARSGADYGLVLAADPAGGLTADLVMVDLKARRMTQRRVAAAGADVAPVRAAVEALVPQHLRRGNGGFTVDLPPGARLKVDGRVVLAQPSRLPVAVTSGRHEVDLLLQDGTAMLFRAEVAEGQTAALRPDLRPPPGERPGGTLQAASAALWGTGAASVATSFALATLGNVRASRLAPCAGASRACLPLDQAMAERQQVAGLTNAANVLLVAGSLLAVAGAGVFTFDLVQTGQVSLPGAPGPR